MLEHLVKCNEWSDCNNRRCRHVIICRVCATRRDLGKVVVMVEGDDSDGGGGSGER